MDPFVQIFISLFVFLPLSLFILISGWRCLRFGIGVLYPPHYFAIFITRVFKGKKAAVAIRREFIERQKERMVGYKAIGGGIVLLVIAIALVVDAMARTFV